MSDKNSINIDDLDILDVDASDIEDLPSFDVPPDGTYKLLLSASAKEFEAKGDKEASHAISFDYEVIDCVQLADPTATAPIPGSKFNELFGLGNEDGIKYLKKAALPYIEHFGTTNMRELVRDKIQNLAITAVLKARVVTKDKDGAKLDEPRRFAQVKSVILD